MKRRSKAWLKARLCLLLLSFTGGLLSVPDPHDPMLPSSDGVFLIMATAGFLMILLFIPPMVLGVIVFQLINPFSDEIWDRPAHDSNPLRLGNPLPFFHFGAFFLIAGGIGMITGSVMGGLEQLLGGFFIVMAGLGCLGGVHWAIRLCKNRVSDPETH